MVAAIILAGFTKLRLGAFGLSEVIVILLLMTLLLNRDRFRVSRMVFAQFWFLILALNWVGLLINVFLEIDSLSIQSGSARFDMIAYFYMLVLCFTFESILTKFSYEEIWSLIKRVFYSSILVIGVLFLLAQFRQTVFGVSLYYEGIRFSPLADNPHQINILTSTLPFIGFRIFKETESVRGRLTTASFLVACLFMNFLTLSDTMKIVYIVCFYLMIVIHEKANRQKKPYYVFAVFVSLILLVGIACSWERFVDLLVKFFEEGDSGGVRFLLWRNSVQAGMHSPIFGLGPGAHTGLYGPFEGIESHQMLLAVFTQTGLIGLVLLMVLLFKVISVVHSDKYIFIVVVGLLVSSLSGTMLRRTVWWMYIMMYYYLAKKVELQ